MPIMPPVFRPPRAPSKRERDQDHDAKRRAEKPWRKWYGLKAWRDIRAAQLQASPWCERCARDGRQVVATVCNHVVRHQGVWERFVAGPFESVCKPCHDAEVQREERAASAVPKQP